MSPVAGSTQLASICGYQGMTINRTDYVNPFQRPIKRKLTLGIIALPPASLLKF